MERVKGKAEKPGEEPDLPVDYFVIGGPELCEWYVSREMARHVEASLDQDPRPAWVAFVDVTGARVRVRARLITHVAQCSCEQRALERAFRRGRRRERKTDRDWDEDE